MRVKLIKCDSRGDGEVRLAETPAYAETLEPKG